MKKQSLKGQYPHHHSSFKPGGPRQHHGTTQSDRSSKTQCSREASLDSLAAFEASKKPVPHPPVTKKAVLLKHVAFKQVDKYANNIVTENCTTYHSLIGALTDHLQNDLDKVRSIFKWLIAIDLDGLDDDDSKISEQSPMWMLRNIKRGSESYHHMFMKLCRHAYIHCVTVTGYSKGAGYQPGMAFDGTEFSNTWSAVLIEKEWRLVDCQWAARHVVAGIGSKRDMTYTNDEHYFLTDPDQFIYSHWAKNPEWQLLKKPHTLEDFINLPLAKSLFFKLGMKFRSHQVAVIKFSATEETIRLDIKPDQLEHVEIKFLLTYEDENLAHSKDATSLDNFVLQQKHKDHVSFGVRLPSTGIFHFEVFGKEINTKNYINNHTFSCLCKYKIVHLKEKFNGQPYPKCAQGEWGPGADCKRHGVVAISHERGSISPTGGNIEIKFLMSRNLQFVAKLVRNEASSSKLLSYTMHRTIGKHVYFTVSLPEYGEYGLDIYAREEHAGDSVFSQMCKYYINTVQMSKDLVEFPLVPNGHWGEKFGFKDLGLTTKSHEDPYIEMDKDDTVTIILGTEKDVNLTYDFAFGNNEPTEVDMSFTFMHRTASEIVLFFRPRDIGLYRIHLYAKEAGDPTDQLPNVFNYLIRNRRKRFTSASFPTAYVMWNRCYLTCPMSGQLMAKEVVQFKLSVAGAVEVAVILGEDWTYLSKTGENWCGDVFIKPSCSGAKVVACFDKQAGNFDTLLHYEVFKD